MSLVTQGTICWGMLQGLGSDVIKPSCSVCFCKVKTNTSMSIWTQLWYFYLPHQLQAAIIISSLMKLVQHLAFSCLFEQMEGHLVWVQQTGSSWGGVCISTFIQRFKAAFLHPTCSAPVMTLDQTQGISVNTKVITCSSLHYPDSYTPPCSGHCPQCQTFDFTILSFLTLKRRLVWAHFNPRKFPFTLLVLFVIPWRQAAEILICTVLSFRPERCKRYRHALHNQNLWKQIVLFQWSSLSAARYSN